MTTTDERQRQHLNTPGPDDHPGRWTIYLDMAITRRKIYHIVTNPFGVTVYRSRYLSECLGYLDAEDVSSYMLIASPYRTLGADLRTLEVRTPETWQN